MVGVAESGGVPASVGPRQAWRMVGRSAGVRAAVLAPYSGDPGPAIDQVLQSPRGVRRAAAREAALRQDWASSAERHREAYALAGSIAARRRLVVAR